MITGKKAEITVSKILDSWCGSSYSEPHIAGYFRNQHNGYTAFDNTTGNCWMEDFRTQAEAIAWCEIAC